MRQIVREFLDIKNNRTTLVPQSADDCRSLIATELNREYKSKILRNLYKLLRAFEDAEDRDLENRKITAIETTNRLNSEAAMRKKADYLLRFVARPLGQQTLLKQNEALQQRIAELEKLVGRAV